MPFVELIIVLFAILTIATPFITLILLSKHTKLRRAFEEAKEEHAKRYASLQREVADLKKQMASAIHPAQPPAEKPAERPIAPAAPPVKETAVPPARVEFPSPLKAPPPTAIPPIEKKPDVQPEKRPQEPATPLPLTTPTTPASVAPPKAPAPPAAPVTPPPTKPPATPPQSPSTPVPAAPLHPAGEMPSTLAARLSTPLPVSAFKVSAPKVSAPKPTMQQRMKTVSAIEKSLGTNWLYKLGIIILVVGVALFGIHELGALGPLGKAAISYFTAIFLLVGGIALEKRERYRLIGRGGIGGGWALLFFSTYGIYHVEPMRVFPLGSGALVLDSFLMLLVAVAMGLHTLRYRSQFVTGLAFLLGYFTVALSQNDVYSLTAGVFLAVGLVSIVLKMGWFELEVFGILSTYLTHLYWLYRLLGSNGAQGHAFPQYHASLVILFLY